MVEGLYFALMKAFFNLVNYFKVKKRHFCQRRIQEINEHR